MLIHYYKKRHIFRRLTTLEYKMEPVGSSSASSLLSRLQAAVMAVADIKRKHEEAKVKFGVRPF